MAKIIIDNFTEGLAPKYWNDYSLFVNRFGKPGQVLYGEVNPFYKPGYLMGGSSTYTALTNESALTDSGRFEQFIIADDNIIDTSSGTSIYGIQNATTGQFHAINPTTNTISSSGSTPKWPKITNLTSGAHNGHTTEVFDDVFRYQVNGVQKTLVLMRDNTDWDILKWDSTLTAGDVLGNVGSAATGYTTSMVNITYPTFAVVSDNSYCYIVDINKVHKFDGTALTGGANGTLTADVLLLDNSRMFVDGVDHQGKIWFLTQPSHVKSSSSYVEQYSAWPTRDISVVVWGRNSSVVNVENNIRLDGCSESFFITPINGVIHVFARGGSSTNSSRGINKLFAYNGSRFVLVKELGEGTSGIPCSRGAIIPYANGVLWQDTDGILWWYGNVLAEGDAITGSLFMVGKTSGSGVTGGAIIAKNSSAVYVSRIESSAMKFGQWDPMASTTSGNLTYIHLAPIELPKLSTINGITIIFLAESNANTGVVALDIYNKNNATNLTKYIDLDVDVPRGYVYHKLDLKKSNMIGLRLGTGDSFTNATLPKIMRIEIDYTPVGRML